jgi:DNA primase
MGIALEKLDDQQRELIAKELFTVKKEYSNRGELHGLCPIHKEKNPSFSYNFKKDAYNCLSCGAAGDLADLWTKVNGYGDEEGFKAFCDAYGIELESASGKKAKKKKKQSEADLSGIFEKLAPLPANWIDRLKGERG